MARLFSALKRAGTRANENLFPAPVDGLLSKDDIARARREGMLHLGLSLLGDTSGMGLGPALAAAIPAGKQAYRGVAEDAYMQRGAARAERGAVREEQEALRQQQVLAQRNAIAAKYRLGPNATPKQIFDSFPKMYAELMAAGDMEGAKNLQGVVQDMLPKDPQALLGPGGTTAIFDPAGNEGKGAFTIGPVIPMSPDVKRENELDRELKLATISAQNAMRDQAREATRLSQDLARGTQIGKAFLSQNRTLVEAEANYQQWSAALQEAKMGNPAAFKSAIVNFVNVADPKAQIRLGVLQFLSKLDPSMQGRFTMTQKELLEGAHPQYLLRAMEQHVDQIHKNQIDLYAHRREQRLGALKNPLYEQFIPTAEELFPSAAKVRTNAAAAETEQSIASSRVSQFLSGGNTPIVPTRPRGPYRTQPRQNSLAPLDPNAGSLIPRR